MRKFITLLVIISLCSALPLSAEVVINELYYDHDLGDTGFEFVELYNNGAGDVDLTGWQIQYGGTDFTYGVWDFPAGASIAAGDYYLVGGDLVSTYFGVSPDAVYNFSIQNGGSATDGARITDEVINPTDPYYDTILYDEPNTNGLRGDDADPGLEFCPDVSPLHSLERVTLGVDNNLAADWFDNDAPTPTRSATGIAPYFNYSLNYPEMVASFSNVQVISEILDDDGYVASASAFYSIDGLNYTEVPMTNIIANRWAADLPQQALGTNVTYYVSATDDGGLTTMDPAGAPGVVYDYTVEDFTLSANIADVRIQDPVTFEPTNIDEFYVIEGYVTVTNEFGLPGPAYIEDETGGMAVYSANDFDWAGIEIGDYVRVYGWMYFYNGLTEIDDEPATGDPNPQVYVIGPASVVEPAIVFPADLGEDMEAELLKVEGCTFIMGGNFTGNFNYDVICGSDTFIVRVDQDTDIVGQPIPTGEVSVTGVLGQYDSSSPYDEGYQLLPRFYTDFESSGDQPPFIGTVSQDPQQVTPADEVNITATIYDDGSLTSTELWYEIAADEFVMTGLFDDGAHGDGAANDSVYGAYIPAQTLGTTVSYYLAATDNIAQTTYQPSGGASSPFVYTVSSGGATPIATVIVNDPDLYPVNYGGLFTIRGIVTSGVEMGSSGTAFIQDETAGVAFYDYLITTSGMAIGDSVELNAYVDFYNGLTQLADDPYNSSNDPTVTILSSGNPVSFATITALELNETYEGQLVKIEGLQFIDTGVFGSGVNALAYVGDDTITVRIDNSTNIVGTEIPTGPVDVKGCVGQYDSSSPYDEGYQLIPRMVEDILAPVTVSDISVVRENDPDGYPVNYDQMFSLEGIITVDEQFGSGGPAYVQDETAGIALYDYPASMFGSIGDLIRVTGWVGFYNGLTQIVDDPASGAAPTVEILSAGNIVEPLEITAMDEDNEAELVTMMNCTFVDAGTFGTGSANYPTVSASGDTFDVRIDGDVEIAGTEIPSGPVNITGVVCQYDNSSPYFEGYQLMPRFLTDIEDALTVTPIADVRLNDPDGYPVNIDQMFTIEGIISVDTQFGTGGPAYMQDETGGLALYDYPASMFGVIGDYVRVTGWVGFYNGLTQIVDDPATGDPPAVTIMSSGNEVVPTVDTEVNEAVESLFTLNPFCQFVETGTFAGNTNYEVVNLDGDTFTVRIDNDTDIPDNPIPEGYVNIYGVVSQYDYSSPYFDGYQLLPRFYTDLAPVGMTLDEVCENDADGRPVLEDSLVTFSALVTATDQFGTGGPAYMMDPTGGIALYDYPISMFEIEIGDIVAVEGWVGFYNGLTQIVDDPATGDPPIVNVLATVPVEYIEAVEIPVTDIGEPTESMLVEIQNCTFTETGTFGGNVNYDVVSGGVTFTVRIDTDTEIVGTAIPEGPVNVVGCLSQYDSSSPYFEGYQLLPRFVTDFSEYTGTTPAIEDLVITVVNTDVYLNWTDVPEATLYHVFVIDTPYGVPYELGTSTDPTFLAGGVVGASAQAYYYVTYDY